MKKSILTLIVLLPLAACSETQRGASVGAAGGALIGGLASGSWEGAAVGAAAGGVTGGLIGRANEPGRCIYRDGRGRKYEVPCAR